VRQILQDDLARLYHYHNHYLPLKYDRWYSLLEFLEVKYLLFLLTMDEQRLDFRDLLGLAATSLLRHLHQENVRLARHHLILHYRI
jgi:hypothetical protein